MSWDFQPLAICRMFGLIDPFSQPALLRCGILDFWLATYLKYA